MANVGGAQNVGDGESLLPPTPPGALVPLGFGSILNRFLRSAPSRFRS